MNNTTILILTLLGILSDLIEFTYDAGGFTRRQILPIVIYIGVGVYCLVEKGWEYLTAQQYTLNVYRTPLTTGLA